MPTDPDKYLIRDGVIRTHGEYYGEREFIPHFAERVRAGHYNYREADPSRDLWCICLVTDEDRSQFPALGSVLSVGIRYEGTRCVSWVRSWSWQKRT